MRILKLPTPVLAPIEALEARLREFWNSEGPIEIAIILVGAFVAYRFMRLATGYFRRLARFESEPLARAQREQRLETLGAILDNLSRVFLIGFAIVFSLRAVRIDVTPIIAGAGIVGLAVGFGAQSLVKDFFSGFFILFENQYAIGDEVTISGNTGTVERMTLRVTVLRDADGSVHIIPNGKIESVTVVSKEWSRVHVDVTIPYGEDLTAAIAAVESAAGDYTIARPELFLEEASVVGVNDLGPRGATVRLTVKTTKGEGVAASRELRRAIVLALHAANIRLVLPREP